MMPAVIADWTHGFYHPEQLTNCTCQVPPPEAETRAASAFVFTAPAQRQGFVRKPLSNITPFVVDPFSFLKPKYLFSRYRDQDSGVSYASTNAQDLPKQLVERLLIYALCCILIHTCETHISPWSFQATDAWLGSGMWDLSDTKTSNRCYWY